MHEVRMDILNDELTNELVRKEMRYSDTLFLGIFTFACIDEFAESVMFSNCNFRNEMIIHSCDFSKKLIFRNCTFYSKTAFSVLGIKGNLELENCNFDSNFEIVDSTIHGKTSFFKCKFNNGINLFSKDEDSFGNVAFEGGLNIFK